MFVGAAVISSRQSAPQNWVMPYLLELAHSVQRYAPASPAHDPLRSAVHHTSRRTDRSRWRQTVARLRRLHRPEHVLPRLNGPWRRLTESSGGSQNSDFAEEFLDEVPTRALNWSPFRASAQGSQGSIDGHHVADSCAPSRQSVIPVRLYEIHHQTLTCDVTPSCDVHRQRVGGRWPLLSRSTEPSDFALECHR